MTDENAASAATGSCNPNSDVLFNTKWILEDRVKALLELHERDGEWTGGYDESEELAKLTASIHALDKTRDSEDYIAGKLVVDIELPSGGTFTAYLEKDLAEELQKCLDRLKPAPVVEGDDPEAKARAEYARQDKARGIEGQLWAFAVDPYKCSRKELRVMDAIIQLALLHKQIDGESA